MRWSILGFAGLFGALCLSLLGGGTVACVVGDAGAGGTAAVSTTATSAPTCDTSSFGDCNTCQACAAGQTTCLAQLEACNADPGCQAIAPVFDSCGPNAATLNPDCLASACAEDPASLPIYLAAAACVFNLECTYSCYGHFPTCPAQ